VAFPFQVFGQILAKFQSSVIGGDVYAHVTSLNPDLRGVLSIPIKFSRALGLIFALSLGSPLSRSLW
jgi:hypothetical protein